MLKLLGSILVIGASAALGLAVRQQTAIRVRALDEWINCIDLLTMEVATQGTPLQESFLTLARSGNRLTAVFFQRMAEQISALPEYDFRSVWRKNIKANAEEWAFGRNELEVLSSIADYIGQYSGEAQNKSLQSALMRLRSCRDEAAVELRSKSSLYRTCGTAVGILLVLILI